jgi:hypothetical protein
MTFIYLTSYARKCHDTLATAHSITDLPNAPQPFQRALTADASTDAFLSQFAALQPHTWMSCGEIAGIPDRTTGEPAVEGQGVRKQQTISRRLFCGWIAEQPWVMRV